MTEYYEMSCGCRFPIYNDEKRDLKDNIPSIEIDFYNIRLDCPLVYELLSTGKTLGVFQLEKSLGQGWSKRLAPENEREVSDLVSILRPGTLKSKAPNADGKMVSMTQHFVDRKHYREEFEPIDDSIKDITHPTYSIIVYQEQAMRIAQVVAGFNLQMCDQLRRCITNDTMFISRKLGWISIKEILQYDYKNDQFLTMNNDGVQTWEYIDNIWSTGKKSVTEVETNFGYSIRATKYHQFLTNNGWKARMRLSEDDYIVCVNEIEFDGEDDISDDLALLLGGVITEGYFTDKTKSGKKTTSHFTAFEQDFMNLFVNAFKNVFNIEPTLDNNKKVVRLTVAQRNYLHNYLEYGFSDSKYIPHIMMKMKKESMRKFLSFMLGAEGGVSQSGQFQYCSKSKKCINQIKYLLLRYGIHSLIYEKRNNKRNEIYYILDINDTIEQVKLLNELSQYWPKYKIENLTKIIQNKIPNFSINIIPQNIVNNIINQYPHIANGCGGRVYSNSITREKFNKLAEKSKDSNWINFANGKQSYAKVSSLEKVTKSIETFDFTIKNNKTPYIIANGLVIHNSMGKKDATLMAKTRIEFIEGCKKTGIIDNGKANEIFDIIEKSNRYSFNKSHAQAYGIEAYWTAYAKAHFTHLFFDSYLFNADEKIDEKEEINLLVNDGKTFGLEFLPPSILDFSENFDVCGNKIRFGIGNISKVGERQVVKVAEAIKKTEEELGKKFKDISWFEILLYFSTQINSEVMKNLICVGAFPHIRLNRKHMLFEFTKFGILTDREIPWLKGKNLNSLQESLELIMIGELKVTKTRKEKIDGVIKTLIEPPNSLKDNEEWISNAEKTLLGIELTCSKLDNCNTSVSNCTCAEFRDSSLKEYRITANIASSKEYRPKQGDMKGTVMCYIRLTDDSGSCEAVAFPDKYKEYDFLLFEGNTVYVTGYKRDEQSTSLTIKTVTQL